MTVGPQAHLIDDDDAVRDSLCMLLEVEGIAISAYASAEAFLRAASTAGDCVVTDAQMPGLGGVGLMQTLRARGLEIPVILITGRMESAVRAQALALGAFRLVEKPFAPDEILGAVRAALDAGKR